MGVFSPEPGWRAWSEAGQALLVFDGSDWTVSGGEQTQAPHFGINAQADEANRLIVQGDAVLLNHDGAGHQVKINKAQDTDIASVLFQSAYSGHAEIELNGDNDLHIKTSPDGASFTEALTVSAQSGAVSVPGGLNPEIMMPSVSDSGGAQSVYGPPNVMTISTSRQTAVLVQNRLYFTPIYVDRPTQFEGGFVTLTDSGSQAGSIIRTGLYKLGQPDGNHWNPGERIADFGTQSVDGAGHKMFENHPPVTLQPGWYLTVIGTNGIGVKARYVEWLTLGLYHYVPFGSGTAADIRVSGPARYLYLNSQNGDIVSGLPQIYSDVAVTNNVFYKFQTVQMFIPKWSRWTG